MKFDIKDNQLVKVFSDEHLDTLVLPGEVSSIKANSFNKLSIGTLVIPEGVKLIESYSFQGANIGSITFPSSITNFGEGLFWGYKNKINVEISNMATGFKYTTFKFPNSIENATFSVKNDENCLNDDQRVFLFTLTDRQIDIENGFSNPKTVSSSTDVIYAKGGNLKLLPYSKQEFVSIKKEAENFRLLFSDYGNCFDYENGGKEDRYKRCYELPFIPNDMILVKDGRFYGCVLTYRDLSGYNNAQSYFTLITIDNLQKVVVSEERRYSEWGNTFSSESAILVEREK